MGCNCYSTMDSTESNNNNSAMKNQSAAGAEVFPEKIRPILARRLEEFKNRRKNNNGGGSENKGDQEAAISKKQLLKKDAKEEDGNLEERVVCVENKLSNMVVPLPASEDKEQEKVKGVEEKKDDGVEEVKVEMIGKSVKPQTENKHEDANKKHGDNDDGEDENEIGRFIGPGSPSFRVYHIEAEKKKKKEKCEKPIVPIVHRKTQSDYGVESAESAASANSYEEVITFKPAEMKPIHQESTKRNKGQKKKKIMLIKKNLLYPLQIKNRMNPMFSCTGSSRKNLLSPH